MKLPESKYLEFRQLNRFQLGIFDKDTSTELGVTELGIIEYSHILPYRQFVARFNEDAVFNSQCLGEIKATLDSLNTEWKETNGIT